MIPRGLRRDPRTSTAPRGAPRPAAQAPAVVRSPARIALGILGLAALGLWGTWWSHSLRADRMTGAEHTWIPALPFLAGDFVHNVDAPTRLWLAGGDPYRITPMTWTYFPYPPLVPRLFAWVGLLSPRTAMVAWLAALTAIAAAGALACWNARRELGLAAVPLPIVLAAVLFSTPILFAIERGNFDLVVLAAVLVALPLWRARSAAADAIAGIVLAAAIWSKLYPGLLVLGLLALRRVRVLAVVAAAGAAIAALDIEGLRRFLENNRQMVGIFTGGPDGLIHPCAHSLSGCWRHLWVASPLRRLVEVPGQAAALGLLLPLVFWIGARIYRCPGRDRLAYPFLLWVLAVATFVPPVANDYNLFFLPLAALAAWDRRDPVFVHVLMAFLLLWWQPLALPIDGRVILAFKLSGLLAVACCLSGRTREANTKRFTAENAEDAERMTEKYSKTGLVIPELPI